MPSEKQKKPIKISLKSGRFFSKSFNIINKENLDTLPIGDFSPEAEEQWKQSKLLEYESRLIWREGSLKERRELLKKLNFTNAQINDLTELEWGDLPSEVRGKIKQYYKLK